VTRWLDDEEMRAWRGMVDVMAAVQAATEADLMASHGLTQGDYGVLVHLSEAPDRAMRMCDLAGRLHLSPSGLTRRLDGLVRLGFVQRVPSAEDRRVMLAELTPQGMTALEEAAPDHVESVRHHFLDHLSRTQVRQLGDAFDRIRAATTGVP
jgi:DNA-binding MarR family transcriptional regulator